MTTETENIISKVKKLLSLSESPNENEAALSTKMAHDLLIKYNLSMKDVSTKDVSLTEEVYLEGGKVMTWKKALLNQIALSNFSGLYISTSRDRTNKGRAISTNKIIIVGKQHNVATVIAMADYLFETINRMAKQNAYGKGKEAVHAYTTGIADSLIMKLIELIKEDEKPGSGVTDIVVSNRAEINNHFKNMRKTKLKTNISDAMAYNQGRMDGESIRLNSQLRGERSRSLQLS